ncbi:MAG: ArnT family glycosyltransferase [Bacteroidia bacterium]
MNIKPSINRNNPFLWLVIGLLSCLFLPLLFTRGMFLDGTIYSSISLNLSKGTGTFWKPIYTGLVEAPFYEHPPFFFWIEGFWFKLIGNQIFTERSFDLLILGLSIWLLIKIIKTLKLHIDPLAAIILLVAIPKFSWSFNNNMMEIMLIPLLLSCFLILIKNTVTPKWFHYPLYAISTICFFLIKGPVALGLVFLPFVFIFNKSFKTITYQFIFNGASIAIGFYLLMLYPNANNNIETYINQQVLASINGNRPSEHTTNQFKIILGTLEQLLIPLLIAALHFIINKEKANKLITFLPLLITGLAFSIPFTLFNKQHIYYIIPSLPFYILFIVGLFNISTQSIIEKISIKAQQAIKVIGILALIIAISISIFNYNNISRDKSLLNDLTTISISVGKNAVTASKELHSKWNLYSYSARHQLVKFTVSKKAEYLVSSYNHIPNGYESVKIKTTTLFLYKKL